jgi:type IV secretory pathway component VirB8
VETDKKRVVVRQVAEVVVLVALVATLLMVVAITVLVGLAVLELHHLLRELL